MAATTQSAQIGLNRSGRRPESKNRATKSVKKLMLRVARQVNLEARIVALCEHQDAKVSVMACKTVLEYLYGKPQEKLELSASQDIHSVIAQARARVLARNDAAYSPPALPAAAVEPEAAPSYREWKSANGLDKPASQE